MCYDGFSESIESRDIITNISCWSDSRAAEGYLDRVVTHPEWGYIVKGILADNKPEGEEYRGIKILGGTDKLAEILPQNQLDEIVITLGLA